MFEIVCVVTPSAVLKALDLPDLGDLQRSSPPDFHFVPSLQSPTARAGHERVTALMRPRVWRFGWGWTLVWVHAE